MSASTLYNKLSGGTLGVYLSVDVAPQVSYALLKEEPRPSEIRKDNYQAWLYREQAEATPETSRILEALQTTDCSSNPNKYLGVTCDITPILRSPEYFWEEEVKRINELMVQECGSRCYVEEDWGATTTNIIVPLNFVVISFNKIVRKHTFQFMGKDVLSVAMERKQWSESHLPTLLVVFSQECSPSVEICAVNNDLDAIGFTINTKCPVYINRTKSSIL